MCTKNDYLPEPTGSGSPSQKGKAKQLNGTFGSMVHTLLHSASLPPKFWSFALLHAIYLKNCIWHSTIHTTPFEALTGTRPSLSHIRIFGLLVTARKPGKPSEKLDKHVSHEIFVGY